MHHHFDIKIAIKHGVNEAIFLNNLAYWIWHNKANNKHFYEERYWTYNTQKAFEELFPYWSRQNLRTIIKSCVDQDLIIKGNFNKSNYDHTHWYTLTEKGLNLFSNLSFSGWNQPMHMTKSTNQSECGLQGESTLQTIDNSEWLKSTNHVVETHQPIPYINTDNKQKIKDKNKTQRKKRVAFDPGNIDLPKWLQKELWIDFVQHRVSIKKPLTELAAKKTINLLTKMKEGGQNIEIVINTSIANGWQGLFEIKSQRSSYGKDSKYHGKNGKFDSTQYLLDSIRLDESKESNPLPENSLSFQDCQYLQYDGTSGDRY